MTRAVARFPFSAPLPALADLGRVHFVAIGGAGMSAVARLMLARGLIVSGSDITDSPTLRALEALGATVAVGHDSGHVAEVDTVVVSSAIPEDNVELARARASGLRVLHRAQALGVLMADCPRLAVAGANGKTTTTGMLTVALQAAGLSPSFASGGVLAGQGTNASWTRGAPFVVEADESDGSFLVYRPLVGIVTSVQPDHLDFYGDFAAVCQAYADFVATMLPGGLLVACADDPGSSALAAAVGGSRPVLTYGWHEAADLRLASMHAEGMGMTAQFLDASATSRTLRLKAPGEHNVLNALAAFAAATHGLGADPEAVLEGLAAFAGTARRFEVHGTVEGVTVVDDYAHNPGKVAAVVQTASRIAHEQGGKLRAVSQPHLYSRTRDFADAFGMSLAAADEVVLLDIYGAREGPMDGVSSQLVANALIKAQGDPQVRVMSAAEAVETLSDRARPGDVLLTIGAGDVTALAPKLLARLRSR